MRIESQRRPPTPMQYAGTTTALTVAVQVMSEPAKHARQAASQPQQSRNQYVRAQRDQGLAARAPGCKEGDGAGLDAGSLVRGDGVAGSVDVGKVGTVFTVARGVLNQTGGTGPAPRDHA